MAFPFSKMHSLVLTCCTLSAVIGHAILDEPRARTGMAVGLGQKITPRPPTLENLNGCSGTPPGPIQRTYCPGSDITVRWNITLNHPNDPGVRIALGYPGQDLYRVLVDGIDVHVNETTVSLPANETCIGCVLHWMWDSVADGGYYIGCSDVAILDSACISKNTTNSNSTETTDGATTLRVSFLAFAVALMSLLTL